MPKTLIQCVVVLYKCSLADSKTLRALAEACRQYGDLAQRISLLIYDNSQDLQAVNLAPWSFGAVEYHQAAENNGLAAAYNQALSKAVDSNVEWLLLLDQDTALTSALFPALIEAIESPLVPEICAVVPKLMQNGKVISPLKVGRLHNLDLPSSFSGACHGKITALNSAACMRVQAITAIGGFPHEYWLEFLDHIMFHRLQAAGGQILILDIAIEHRLSIHNLEAEMGLGRYANVLSAEWRFIRETGSGGGSLVHRLRLLKRTFSHAVKRRNKAYAIKTLQAILKIDSSQQ